MWVVIKWLLGGRKLAHDRTQCRSALSEKDVKLTELKRQLSSVNAANKHAADQVRTSCYSNVSIGPHRSYHLDAR